MGAPTVESGGNRVDDLAVEIEAEVVTGSEVGEPLVADADHPAVDLFDDRVRHRIRALELGEVAAGSKPSIDPARGRAELGPGANGRASSSHDRKHRLRTEKPLEAAKNLHGRHTRRLVDLPRTGPART